MIRTCRQCGATIVWARTTGGDRIAVDYDRTPDGSVHLVHLRLYDEPEARLLDGRAKAALRVYQAAARAQGIDSEPELRLHRAHRLTCQGRAAAA